MNRTAITILVVLILFNLSNLYANYVVNVSNHYRKSNEPEWLSQILIGMPEDELMAILEDNNVSYVKIETTLDDHTWRANRDNIHCICIDLRRGGLARFPSEYMLAFEIHEKYSGEVYSPFQQKEPSHEVYLPLSITSTLVFGFLAWDYFAQAKDLSDSIDSGIYSGYTKKELKKIRTRKRIIAWSSLAATINGSFVCIQIIQDLSITARPDEVKLTYNF